MNYDPDAQLQTMRAIPGLEKVEIHQPGYGVAYDFVNPRQLFADLSVKKLPGLYLAVSSLYFQPYYFVPF
jgi:tRNA uridine 5-carboxymethylaminomethyl modification enzyme